jgi:hypothetical protein
VQRPACSNDWKKDLERILNMVFCLIRHCMARGSENDGRIYNGDENPILIEMMIKEKKV